jgi:uncharacterized protein YbaR (Trm112 family)
MSIRKYIDIVEAVRRAPFILQPNLKPENYIMTGSLRDVARWRAMTYVANNGGSKGEMDEVGYVMISTKDNTIIPIANNDDHHTGKDVLYTLGRRYNFNDRDYVPIDASGRNYIYTEDEIPVLLNVITKFLSYGGINGTLNGSYDMHKVAMTLEQFVESNGNINVEPGQLAPIGKYFVETYQRTAQALSKARGSLMPSTINAAFKAAAEIPVMLEKLAFFIPNKLWKEIKEMSNHIAILQQEQNIPGLENYLFGFDSIKNKVHISLKQLQAQIARGEPPDYSQQRTEMRAWGDIDLAIDVLGRF